MGFGLGRGGGIVADFCCVCLVVVCSVLVRVRLCLCCIATMPRRVTSTGIWFDEGKDVVARGVPFLAGRSSDSDGG